MVNANDNKQDAHKREKQRSYQVRGQSHRIPALSIFFIQSPEIVTGLAELPPRRLIKHHPPAEGATGCWATAEAKDLPA
jgi:hypothetical protein